MTNPDFFIYIITALLPICACMVVFQVNPYHALIVRGILGAIAALTYSVLGAADVALTEALVGTMLAITLYAVAVRSSLVMRLGVLEGEDPPESVLDAFRAVLKHHYMRLELVHHDNAKELHQALLSKEVHATCVPRSPNSLPQGSPAETTVAIDQSPSAAAYQTIIRVQRLYDIFNAELSSPETTLTYISPPSEVPAPTGLKVSEPGEVQP